MHYKYIYFQYKNLKSKYFKYVKPYKSKFLYTIYYCFKLFVQNITKEHVFFYLKKTVFNHNQDNSFNKFKYININQK